MSDQTTPQNTGLQITDDTLAKFGPMIELIKGSESMNNEERQYWINILPIMTMEQLKNLEEILTSEKKQLNAIDAKYSKEAATLGQEASVSTIEQKIKMRKKERELSEREAAMKEEEAEQEILQQIQSF